MQSPKHDCAILLIKLIAILLFVPLGQAQDRVTTRSITPEAVETKAALNEQGGLPDTSGTDLLRQALDLWRKFVARQAVERSARCDDFHEEIPTSPALTRPLNFRRSTHFAPESLPPPAVDALGRPAISWRDPVQKRVNGLLERKIVYCSGGHGWTCDNTSTTLWYTQRPLTHGIVEDYGNLDQLNLFADTLWRVGATIVPLRPLGNQPIERVVDNTDSKHVTFEGTWFDSRSAMYYGAPYDSVPYRFAIAETTESARAVYQPFIPKADFYPVYCWVRDGADRVPQLYRIHHAAGVSEVRIDHRRVGKGWVFLGEYYFQKGWSGFVEISNWVQEPQLADGRHVVVADAIRFGNGMGNVTRGGTISGYPREEEASRYWVERMLPVGAPPIFDPFEASDQDSNVGTPPRMTAFMNREKEGGFFDRIYIGFHTNAAGGRGVVGLFNKDEDKRPDHQVELAELVAQQLNEDVLTTSAVEWPTSWVVRKRLTASHINFGEIRRDAIANEMCATIIEAAFHDNPADAAFIRHPRFRQLVADSAVKAVTRFLFSKGSLPADQPMPPAAPKLLLAAAVTSSSLWLEWEPPSPVLSTENSRVTGYRVYRSPDGFGLTGGYDVGATTGVLIQGLEPGKAHFFSLTAINEGGESRRSALLGARFSETTTAPCYLLAYAFSTFSEDVVLSQTVPAGLGATLRGGGEFVRVIPRRMNAQNYVAHWGRALAEAGCDFNSCDVKLLSRLELTPTTYSAVMILLGKQSPAETPFNTTLIKKLDAYNAKGGGLVICGTNVVKCLASSDLSSSQRAKKSQKFAPPWIPQATTESLRLVSALTGAAKAPFAGKEFSLDRGEGDAYPATGCDALRLKRERPLFEFWDHGAQWCVASYAPPSRGRGPWVMAGFPLETVQPAELRAEMMRELVKLLPRREMPKPQSSEQRPPRGKHKR